MIADILKTKLTEAFHPSILDIVNESHLHAGHAGVPKDSGGETHFRVKIVSPAFDGISRIKRHQMVYAVLTQELKSPIHALTLTTLAPHECTA